ncbi:MAG TPA: amidohydrolase family protein [Anaeromyxobacteraceae bacterium]|nr:amidohydrolase family protein [Anaeromyxobacteraceae bacterium]
MSPRRAWFAVFLLALSILAAVLALATYLERRRPHEEYRFIDVWKIDAHERADPRAVALAMSLAATQRIHGLVTYAGGHVGDGLEAEVAAASRYPGRVAVFMELDLGGCCGEDWSGREVVRMVQGRAGGARGLSVPRELGVSARDGSGRRVAVDAPELEPIWDMAWRLEIPVAVHAFGVRPAEARRDELVHLVESHPQLAFIAPRFADAEDPAGVSRLLDRLPNLYVDTAGCIAELGQRPETARAAILAHADRVLFGTGLAYQPGPKPDLSAVVLGSGRPARSVAEIRRFFESTWRFFESRDEAIPSPVPDGPGVLEGLGLPQAVLEKVYHANAERLFGFRPPGTD